MIFVRDKGRMCNNILQYGHVYAWAREHGRRCMSMRFSYKYQYFKICFTACHCFLVYVLAKYAAKCGLLPIASFEKDGDYRKAESLMEQNKNIVVEGWYVRFYDLFLKYRHEIVDLFSFKEKIVKSVDAFLEKTASTGGIRLGVHIRRGDYKTWRNGVYFYEDDVYINYIRQFASLYKDKKIIVYICGNDPLIDTRYYQCQLKGLEIVFPHGNPGADLCLLSKCDYLIGAPSTFSLVAAMYRDIPLCWILKRDCSLSGNNFKKFETLFREIL